MKIKIKNSVTELANTINDIASTYVQIIILTQAEYDALPETKNADGIVYLIKE